MKKHRCLQGAIIGFGNMAEQGHLPGWLRERRVSLQAVCDPNPARRKRAAQLLPDVRIYSAPADLYARETLDFVDICTPPPFHATLLGEALRHDVHALCEKPFVGTLAELREVRRLAQQKRRIAFPVHNWKDAPILARAIGWVREGRIGKVIHSEFHTLRRRPAAGLTPWRSQTEEAGGGGILLDHGWHAIYLLLNFHRERPRSVSASLCPSPPARRGRAEHTAHLLMRFRDATASLFLTWRADRRYNAARIYGDKGLLVLEDDRIVLRPRQGGARVATYKRPLSHGSHHPDWFGPVMARFLGAVEDRRRAVRELEEASLCLEIMLKGYASARQEGQPVPIPPAKGGNRG